MLEQTHVAPISADILLFVLGRVRYGQGGLESNKTSPEAKNMQQQFILESVTRNDTVRFTVFVTAAGSNMFVRAHLHMTTLTATDCEIVGFLLEYLILALRITLSTFSMQRCMNAI